MKSTTMNIIAVLVFLAVFKLFMTPSQYHLVPRFEGGQPSGYTLRASEYWGLSYNEYPATFKGTKAFYTTKKNQLEIVPQSAYEDE